MAALWGGGGGQRRHEVAPEVRRGDERNELEVVAPLQSVS